MASPSRHSGSISTRRMSAGSSTSTLESRGIAHLEEIERIAVDVESGALDARSGAVAFQARAWVAARLNPRMLSEKWKAELDVQPSIQSLHLDAIRSLTKKQIDQNQAKTAVEVDGTYK